MAEPDKASFHMMKKYGVAISLKITEDSEQHYSVWLKALGNDWMEISCMLVPHTVLKSSGGASTCVAADNEEADADEDDDDDVDDGDDDEETTIHNL